MFAAIIMFALSFCSLFFSVGVDRSWLWCQQQNVAVIQELELALGLLVTCVAISKF
jgi:hypothetical protein